jgi:hypothetical protein
MLGRAARPGTSPRLPQPVRWNHPRPASFLTPGLRHIFGSMTPNPNDQEEYRNWAAECLRLAQAESDMAMRLRFLTMAQRWLDLSEGDGPQGDETAALPGASADEIESH